MKAEIKIELIPLSVKNVANVFRIKKGMIILGNKSRSGKKLQKYTGLFSSTIQN